jgi:hypothetical protein
MHDFRAREVVATGDVFGHLCSDTHSIPPGETRSVSISLFCTLPLEMLIGQVELQIVVVDQLSHDHLTPSITLPVLYPLLENLPRDRASSNLKWTVYKHGYLLKSNHGYYFVYLQFDDEERADRWFTEMKRDRTASEKTGSSRAMPSGFRLSKRLRRFAKRMPRIWNKCSESRGMGKYFRIPC